MEKKKKKETKKEEPAQWFIRWNNTSVHPVEIKRVIIPIIKSDPRGTSVY